MPPVAPMLCKSAKAIPEGDYLYEPKWDGFRCIVFRDGDEVELGSRNGKPLTRYFPEIVAAVKSEMPEKCVIDGEVVVAGPDGLDFEMLSQRIHPAASRVEMLSKEWAARFVAFDLISLADRDLSEVPFAQRRSELETVLERAQPPIHITPITDDPVTAADWFDRFEGAGLDGVVAKGTGIGYMPDQRSMIKIKHERTGDFVVAGFRWYAANKAVVGSLMLGLYDGEDLHHVGVIGSFPVERRKELVDELAPYRDPTDHPWSKWSEFMVADGGRAPGVGNRWNAKKDLSFELLRPELVVEAAFEHLQGKRLRHTARFRRWRPDREANSCTYEQMDIAVPALLSDVFGAGR